MSSMSEPTVPAPRNAKRSPATGLRTGKIRATKASASDILRAIGVRPADLKVAARVLRAVEPVAKPSKPNR